MKAVQFYVSVLLGCTLLLTGCWKPASELKTGSVSGKVLNGTKPVSKAQVRFISQSGPMATGTTTEDGSFFLLLPNGEKGALQGDNAVSVIVGLPEVTEAEPRKNTEGMVLLPMPTGPVFLYSFSETIKIMDGPNEVTLDLAQAKKRRN